METRIEGIYEVILRVRQNGELGQPERDIEFHFPVRNPDSASAVVTQNVRDYDDISVGIIKFIPVSTLESLDLEVRIKKGDTIPGMENHGERLMWYFVTPVEVDA